MSDGSGIFTRNRLRIAILAFLALGIAAGCVSQSKYEALEAGSASERSKLQDEIAALKSQKAAQEAALNAEKAKLQEQIAALQEQLAALQAEKADLEAKRQAQSREMEAMTSQKDEEINRLKGTYDDLVKNLKGEIEKGEVTVTRIRDRLSVNMVEKVLFDSGRAEIKPKGKEVLKKVGKILVDIKDKEIRIEGYTDNVPIGESLQKQFPTNWELSTERATTVLRFLEEEAGVNGEHLSAVGYGPYRPVASNDTPQGRAENRRIEIVLAPADIQGILKGIQP